MIISENNVPFPETWKLVAVLHCNRPISNEIGIISRLAGQNPKHGGDKGKASAIDSSCFGVVYLLFNAHLGDFYCSQCLKIVGLCHEVTKLSLWSF